MTSPKKPLIQPGVRVSGGKRVDLAALRAKKAAVKESNRPLRLAPTTAQIKAAARAEAKQAAMQARRTKRLKEMDGGKDGAVTATISVRISETRRDSYQMRSRPGSFEWVYGRNKQTALFHAGNHFAILWERAGATVASSSDFLRGTKSGYNTGLPAGRVLALDQLQGTVEALGKPACRDDRLPGRHVDECDDGTSALSRPRSRDGGLSNGQRIDAGGAAGALGLSDGFRFVLRPQQAPASQRG